MIDLPLGALCPINPHAVVVSLPTIRDVIGYETGCPRVKAAVTVGYPRFVLHKYVCTLSDILLQHVIRPCYGAQAKCIVVCNIKAGEGLLRFAGATGVVIAGQEAIDYLLGEHQDTEKLKITHCMRKYDSAAPNITTTSTPPSIADDLWSLVVYSSTEEVDRAVKAFAQHTGCRMSSRLAYSVLQQLLHAQHPSTSSVVVPLCNEERWQGREEEAVRAVHALLHSAFTYRCPQTGARLPIPPSHLVLTNSGMGAFTAVQSAVRAVWEGVAGGKGGWPCPQHPAGRHRDTWLQLGWLYLDTTCALQKFSTPACPTCDALDQQRSSSASSSLPPGAVRLGHGCVQVLRVEDTACLEQVLQALGPRLAGVVTECPTNPLVCTPDLPALAQAVRAHTGVCMACGAQGVAARPESPSSSCTHPSVLSAILVADPTMAGLGNVDVTWQGHADIGVVSLTKYAAGAGDIMAGAIALHPNSPHATSLAKALSHVPIQRPTSLDLSRLAVQAKDCPSLVQACNANLHAVATWLEGKLVQEEAAAGAGVSTVLHPRAVHWSLAKASSRAWPACAEASAEHYRALATVEGRVGSMMTLELHGTWPSHDDLTSHTNEESFHGRAQDRLATFFDRLPLVKGPSFGTSFSIATPFAYLVSTSLPGPLPTHSCTNCMHSVLMNRLPSICRLTMT